MQLISYINSKRGEPFITDLKQISDEEFIYYNKLRNKELHPTVPKPRKIKEKKVRIDKGKSRTKYDSSLSQKHKRYLARANAKGLEFTLTGSEFDTICKGICIYCQNPATGIDRRNNKQGYTLSNSQPCCHICNTMKGAMSEGQFIEHCQTILYTWQVKHYQ